MRFRAAAKYAVAASLFLLGAGTWPRAWCGRNADAWFDGRADRQAALARSVERWVGGELSRTNFATGRGQFDGEWLFGSYLMAGFGLGQCALEHPADDRARRVALVAACIDAILRPDVRAFDAESWLGEDPIDSLDGPSAHAAYLGYLNLLLGFHRLLDPDSRHAALNDRITAALARRLEASPILMIETYPGETYPVDNCAVAGSIGLHDRVTGADHGDLLRRWREQLRRCWVDPRSGLLVQSIDSRTGAAVDWPRASGTSLGLYFLSFWDPGLASELYAALRSECAGTRLGFGGMREYPAWVRAGTAWAERTGDIDSGPVLLGFGLSPTGFSLGPTRMFGDRETFRDLFATAWLFGAPVERGGRFEFVAGGPLGNAILLAMVTAPPGGGGVAR
jgi:hypothetical protein